MMPAIASVPSGESATDGLWIVVPAYNEAMVIRVTVAGLRAICPKVVVVDDASTDGTAAAAAAAGATVLSHPINLGQGAALQTGIEYALREGARHIATFDADGQHHAADLRTMVEVLRGEGLDIVLGSRFLGATEAMPVVRRMVLKAAVVFTNRTSGLRLTDTHNGIRVMTAAAASRLDIRQNRMAHASEILNWIARNRLRYGEVPVTVTYSAYSLAKGQRVGNSFRILSEMLVGWIAR
jgi:glycosyltransferase involved in cell wall biosynthesis